MFDTSRPGRDCSMLPTWDKAGRVGQAGIVSCFAFNPDRSGVFAAGAYDGSVAVYDVRTCEQQLLLHGHSGGVTHARFSPDGNYLYTGARRDGRVLCWDVRATSGVVYTLQRGSECTNQRLGFDIEPGGRHLLAGGTVRSALAPQLACLSSSSCPSRRMDARACSISQAGRRWHPSPRRQTPLAGRKSTRMRRWRSLLLATVGWRRRTRLRRVRTSRQMRCACGASSFRRDAC